MKRLNLYRIICTDDRGTAWEWIETGFSEDDALQDFQKFVNRNRLKIVVDGITKLGKLTSKNSLLINQFKKVK